MDGFLTQWAFHRVQEHPNRSSDGGVMTFQSLRLYVGKSDELPWIDELSSTGRALLSSTGQAELYMTSYAELYKTSSADLYRMRSSDLFCMRSADLCCMRSADLYLTTSMGLPLTHLTVQSKKTITWSTGVRIEKFKSLTSSSLMWLQFPRRTYYQILFISDPKTHYNVRLVDPNWTN